MVISFKGKGGGFCYIHYQPLESLSSIPPLYNTALVITYQSW